MIVIYLSLKILLIQIRQYLKAKLNVIIFFFQNQIPNPYIKKNSINQILISALFVLPTTNYFKIYYVILNINRHFEVIKNILYNLKKHL